MLNKIFEWSRIVDPNPSDDYISKRTDATKEFLDIYSKAEDYELVYQCTLAVVNGLEGFDPTSEFVESIIEIVRNHQPAFPSDLTENALELRVFCAIIIGEILINDNKDYGRGAEIAASLLISADGLKAPATERYLFEVISELRKISVLTLEKRAEGIREVDICSVEDFKKLEPLKVEVTNEEATDEVAVEEESTQFWQKLFPALEKCLNSLQKQVSTGREELEVLWWLYNGFSEKLKRPLESLEPGQAAIACGIEIADKILCPPLFSLRNMVMQSVDKNREKAEISEMPLEQFVDSWDKDIWELLSPSEAQLKKFVLDYPAIFPLSWIGLRLSDSKGVAEWHKEFHAKTGVDPNYSMLPAKIALQAFNERVALKIYSEVTIGI